MYLKENCGHSLVSLLASVIKNNSKKVDKKGNKIYVGIWKDGQSSGEISIYNTKGNLIYKGEYKDNAENGKGIKYLNKIGEYLIGDFKNGKFEITRSSN